MKILFTGATGVLGRAGVPALVDAGHDVTAVARSETDGEWLEEVGARPMAVDLFDPTSVRNALSGIDTVVHHATAIPAQSRMTKRGSWELNDRLRDTATGILVDAAIAQGVSRFVQQSVTLVYGDGDAEWLDEASPVAPVWDVLDSALAAERHVDRFRESGGVGVVLRLSRLYGPGHASDEMFGSIEQRKMPIIGSGNNYVSSIHVDDATSALRAAMSAPAGTYNVTDDVPVTSAGYVSDLAEMLDAPTPRRIPASIARLIVGPATGLLTISQRVSNRLLSSTTGWKPEYPSAHDGFAAILAERE